jgi:hypothetical protein
MTCIKCKQEAVCVVKVDYMNIDTVFACMEHVDEVKKDFNLAFIHFDSDDLLYVNRIHKKYGL